MSALRLAVVTTGDVFPNVERAFGGTGRWLSQELESTTAFRAGALTLQVYDATRGQLPDVDQVDGVVISGNFGADASLAAPADAAGRARALALRPAWIHGLDEYLLRQLTAGTPTLGVCFGHQKLVDLLGGRVVRNPAGFELGTATVHRVPDDCDWFLRNVPAAFAAQQFHSDIGVEVDKIRGARILASNANTENQIMAIDDGPIDVRSVQFHPEAKCAVAQALVAEIGGPALPVSATPDAGQLVENFVDHVVEKARARRR